MRPLVAHRATGGWQLLAKQRQVLTASLSYEPFTIAGTVLAGTTWVSAWLWKNEGTGYLYADDLSREQETNQLIIANSSPDTWYYEYDNNGNQMRQVPNGLMPAAGEVRYTFNQRNHLVRIETHDGSDYRLQGEAMYDGDGQRVQTVAYVMGIPLTTTYSLDRRSGNPLLVDSGGSQRVILYGLFALGEVGGSDWHYYLGDGRFSVRQLVNESGDLALTRSYDPFGVVLQETGSAEALFGFMGAQAGGMGLLYVVEILQERRLFFSRKR